MLITNDKSHSGVNKKYLIDGSSDETRLNMVIAIPTQVRFVLQKMYWPFLKNKRFVSIKGVLSSFSLKNKIIANLL